MTDLIHVKGYIKDDDTEVKEHYRGKGPSGDFTSSFREGEWEQARKEKAQSRREKQIPQSDMEKGPIKLLLENFFPKRDSKHFPIGVANANDTVLNGGVIFDEILGGGTGDGGDISGGGEGFMGVVTTVIAVVTQTAITVGKIAIDVAKEMAKEYARAQKTGSVSNLQSYDARLEDSISKFEESQDLLKGSMKTTMDKLVKTKDQGEYVKLLETHTDLEKMYSSNAKSIDKVKKAVQGRDYTEVVEGLKEYSSGYSEALSENKKIFSKEARIEQGTIRYDNIKPSYVSSYPSNVGIQNNQSKIVPHLQKAAIDIGMSGLGNVGVSYDAKELWKAASQNFQQSSNYINKNGQLISSVSKLPSSTLQKTVSTKLQNQLGTKDGLGVVFSSTSSISQAIASSSEFKEHIIKCSKALLKGEVVEQASTYFKSDKNLALALGHADILYTHIDAKGDINALVFDTYDFNPGENWTVQWARDVQEAGLLKNYYTLNIIVIPWLEWSKW